MDVALENCPALVLNADFRPLSYFPLSLWPWQEAVKATLMGRVNTVAQYDRVIRSPSIELALPSVVSLKEYVRPAERPAFTRPDHGSENLMQRDYSQNICGKQSQIRAVRSSVQ